MNLEKKKEEKIKLKQSLNIFEENTEEINKQNIKLKEDLKNKEKILIEKISQNNIIIKENEKLNEELLLLKQENEIKKESIKKNEKIIKELNEELNEKNIQLENTIKNINDYEIQIKGLKDEKQDLIINKIAYICLCREM